MTIVCRAALRRAAPVCPAEYKGWSARSKDHGNGPEELGRTHVSRNGPVSESCEGRGLTKRDVMGTDGLRWTPGDVCAGE